MCLDIVKKILFYLLVLFAISIHSQEIPPIQVFTPQDYGAEEQNWAITQSENNFIYIANNKGLLEYNGASWKLYNSPNDGILRSVKVVDNKIYSGGYMDFGYWTKDSHGNLHYTSLTKDKNFEVKDDEDFWGIIDVEGYILFQSFDRIYIYNKTDKSIAIINSELRINKIFKVNQSIYFQKIGIGIFEIQNGKAQLIIPAQLIKDDILVNIYNSDLGLLLQTREDGFYHFQNNVITKWNIEADTLLSNISVYSSTRLRDGSFILGTISNGIIQLDRNGNVLLKIDQFYGLSNNTILSIKEDNLGSVWLGLDNGVNVINLKSPYKVYKDKLGVLGTVYASEKVNDYLYLGTNQGLFYKTINSNEKFKFIKGTQGQTWYLKYIKGTLFCGHDRGTFVIENNVAIQISTEIGTWNIKEIDGRPNLLLQGNYKGLNVLENINNKWRFRNKIEGFDISSRYYEIIDSGEILLSHELKGIYKISIDNTYRKVTNLKKLNTGTGIYSSIIEQKGSIFYSYRGGVFRFDKNSESFKKDSTLSQLFGGENYLSGKLINDKVQNRLWGFTKNEIIYVEPGKLSNEPKTNVIEIPNTIRKTKSGFENILPLDKNAYLIGNTEGYFIINLNEVEQTANQIYLNEVSYTSLQNEFISIDITKPIDLVNKNNTIQFKYSDPSYNTFSRTIYQYRLLGIYDSWSEWSTSSETIFENLPFGDYTFEARSKTSGLVSSNTLSYNFIIEKPWFLKPLAIVMYVLAIFVLGFLVRSYYKRQYKKQKQKLILNKERERELEQLENQRQLMQFKNKNLQLDIESKNRELGSATMNLVNRNELLNNLKEELTKSKSLDDFKKVIQLINSSLNNTKDWKVFEEAFNNVDKDFMKKVKTLHPSVTPNDLRLCAYLRLNLSSKEIAPLLNISHKSVEVKRYRLRKKMGLSQNQSLSNYIIEL